VRVSEIMGHPMPIVDEAVDIMEPYRLFMAGHGGVVTSSNGKPTGFLSRFDIMSYWTAGQDPAPRPDEGTR
jgi:predicted transcriptional regulator